MKSIENKGFTLIELVAIVALLSIIFLVTFPQLQSTMKQDEEKQYTNFINTLCESAREYVYNTDEYKEFLNSGKTKEILIQDLINYDIVDSEMVNPKTEESIKNGKLKVKFETDGMLTCEYVE